MVILESERGISMLIVDQIIAQWAIVEWQEQMIKLPLALLPSTIKEGDVLEINISINQDATTERRKSLENRLNNLWQR